MTFHGSPPGGRRRRSLSQDEINSTGKRIRNIVGDAARTEFNDFEFNAYSDRQVDRNMDIDGNVVDTRFEKFEPSAKRQDLSLDGSLGDNADNIRREVFAVKKVMSKAGAFDFDPGNEPTTVANVRFKTAIRNFQAANDLNVDGLIRPGGPTIHMLGLKAIGQEDGKPSGYDAADFKQITGRDPNLTLTGKAIFKTPGENGGAGKSRTQEATVIGPFFPPAPPSSGDGEPPVIPPLPPILPLPPLFPKSKMRIPRIPPDLIKRFEKWARDLAPIFEPETQKPITGKTPAYIFRYQDGRVYIRVNKRGKISLSQRGPGGIVFEEIRHKVVADSVISNNHRNYPNFEDRRSHQERYAAGLESYVYGPVFDKDGVLTGYLPLVDPSTRGLFKKARILRAPVGKEIFLTRAQIKAMGLSKWHVVKQ